jgi:serine/threonine protein kinase/Tfp pilus assembly protein PilF
VCLFKTGLGFLDDGANGAQEPSRIQVEFGDYELLEEIGRGGQGVVYRARQKSLNRIVALKVIGLGKWSSTPHLKRFRHEAEAAASLEHPQIVPIYEIGERDGSCYFSMQFIEGGQLDQILKREPMSSRPAAELLVKIARTVQFAHEHGILHRDIKPGNILVDKNGEPHLTDFGLARLIEQQSTVTNSFDVLGTPSYMSPEQAAGHTKELTAAADVYSLGAVFYQMLTGEPPFAGGTTYETIRMVLESEPRNPRTRNPKVDGELATICLKCLEKNPAQRYESAAALADDVERWLRHEPIQAKRSGFFTHTRKWVRRKPAIAAVIALSLALAAAVGSHIWKSELIRRPTTTGIAVLPFQNLSNDREDEFFADGVQDDILIKLAKIADLKVISRTSVMQYRGKQNMHEIGNALRVSHVLEGTVRRSGKKVHVNAQLVDVHADRGIWAEEYDRDLNDVFAIETEVAQSIANRLRAKVTARERAAIQEWPTKDLVAYDLYTRANNLLLTTFSSLAKAKLLDAADLLNKAIARDPSFLDAFCRLAYTHDQLYFLGFDHTPERRALARAAVEEALRLRPEAGEAHLALAENLYWGYLDYDGALAELQVAQRTLSNQPRLFALRAYINRRQGRWEQSVRDFERSIELDPRNFFTLQQIAATYGVLHRYPEEISVLERALTVDPDNLDTKIALAAVQFHWRADTRPLRRTIDSTRTTDPGALLNVVNDWLSCALAERDFASAKDALDALGNTPLTDYAVHLSRPVMEGVIARMRNDAEKARAAFTAARTEQEKIVQAQPDYGPALCVLGLIDAGLERKEEALREGRRAVELKHVKKESITPLMITYLAMIAGWVGDKDLACEQLAIAVRPPSYVSYGQLKLLPFWDPLRGDPRFEEIVNSLAPK